MKSIETYDAIIAANDEFERKGKKMLYTSANGYMFSLINKDGELGMRLPKERQKEFRERYNATEFRSHGAVMRDYVKIPEDLYDNIQLLADLIKESYDYVLTLPPK